MEACTTASVVGGTLVVGLIVVEPSTLGSVVVVFGTVTGMIVLPVTIPLVAYNPQSATNLGLSDIAAILTDTETTLDGKINTIDTVVDAIKAVTDLLPDAGALSDLAAILTDTGTTLPATLATIAGYLDTEIAAIKAVTDLLPDAGALTTIGTDTARLTDARAAALTDLIDGGRLDLLIDAIKVVTDLQAKLVKEYSVDTVTNTHTPTTTQFQTDSITEATTDHFNGRLITFTSGDLIDEQTVIEDYINVGGIGQFTVTGMTEPPANNDTFVIT